MRCWPGRSSPGCRPIRWPPRARHPAGAEQRHGRVAEDGHRPAAGHLRGHQGRAAGPLRSGALTVGCWVMPGSPPQSPLGQRPAHLAADATAAQVDRPAGRGRPGARAAPIRRFLWARSDEDASATVAAGAEAAIQSGAPAPAGLLADLFDQYQVYRADWLDDWAQHRDQLAHPLRPAQPCRPTRPGRPACGAPSWPRSRPDEQQTAALACTAWWCRPARGPRARGSLCPACPPRGGLRHEAPCPCPSSRPWKRCRTTARCCWRAQPLSFPGPTSWMAAMLRMARRRFAPAGRQDLSLFPAGGHARPRPSAPGQLGPGRPRLRAPARRPSTTCSAPPSASSCRAWTCSTDAAAEWPLAGPGAGHIRDMVPLPEHPHIEVPPADQSIVSPRGHSPQRELEVLHDHLLSLLSQPAAPGEARCRRATSW